MMRHSPDDLRQITGLRLSPKQAEALQTFARGGRRGVRHQTVTALRRMGLISYTITRGPRGGRHGVIALTAAGAKAASHLDDACEFSVSRAAYARLTGMPIYVAHLALEFQEEGRR